MEAAQVSANGAPPRGAPGAATAPDARDTDPDRSRIRLPKGNDTGDGTAQPS